MSKHGSFFFTASVHSQLNRSIPTNQITQSYYTKTFVLQKRLPSSKIFTLGGAIVLQCKLLWKKKNDCKIIQK